MSTTASFPEVAAPAALTFAIFSTDYGLALIATEGEYLRALFLGDSADGLREELRERFPKIALTEGSLSTSPEPILAALHQPGNSHSLASFLKPYGTAFQRRVWTELCRIPTGETVTYGRIAERLGAPGAVRAVGTACGANPISILIPCHRVVGTGGKLHGYRWGLERKRALLERESGAH